MEISNANTIILVNNFNWVLEFKTKKMKKKLEKNSEVSYEEKQKVETGIIADIFLKKAIETRIKKEKERQSWKEHEEAERKMIRGSKKSSRCKLTSTQNN